MTTTRTISLEPDYNAMFATFFEDARRTFAQIIEQARRDLRLGRRISEISLQGLHRLWGPLTIAVQTAASEEQIRMLQEFMSASLADLDEVSRRLADDDVEQA